MKEEKSVKKYLIIALMAAIISILSPMSIMLPISPVPISLATFAIYLTAYVLGGIDGAISTMIYVLLGIVGAPVFTGFTGGIAKILGPTGGYIIAYVFLAIIAGTFVEKFFGNTFLCFVGMVIGTIVLYLVGTLWLSYVAGMSFDKALFAGVIPFIPGDIVKMILAHIVGTKIRHLLIKGKYI